jgi:hypothetical protein
MKESDYFEDFGEAQGAGSDEDESEEEEVDVKAKKGKGKDKLMNELELLALGNEGTHVREPVASFMDLFISSREERDCRTVVQYLRRLAVNERGEPPTMRLSRIFYHCHKKQSM